MKAYWKSGGIAHSFFDSTLYRGEWLASRPGRFIPRERDPGTHWIEGWVGPRAVLDAVMKRKIPSPRRESNPRTPIVQTVAQCSNYSVISLLTTTYKILPSILISVFIRYVDEIMHHQCRFRSKGSTNDQIFCIRYKLNKEWGYNGTVHRLFVDCEKAMTQSEVNYCAI
jgi:hypothetical protein